MSNPKSATESHRPGNFLLRAMGIASVAGLAVGLYFGIRFFV